MYNSQNLPLSPRKVIKKSLGRSFGIFILSIIFGLIAFSVAIGYNVPLSKGIFYGVIIVVVFDVVTIGMIVFYQYLYYKFYYYNFEEDKAEIKKGVIAMATGHVRYGKIQNIYVDQDILDRILGLYDVHYETAGERSGFYSNVDGLNKENADKLVAFLNDRVLHKDSLGTPSANQGVENSEAVKIEDTDQRIFTRENIPIDKKIILSMIINGTLSSLIILAIIVARISMDDESGSFLGVFLLLFVPAVILAVVATFIYAKIWYKNFYFKFDGKGGIITQKVLSVSNTYVYYNRIQNIDVSQSFVERLLGLSKVAIETASEGNKAKAINIPGLSKKNAETLKEFLLDKSRHYQSV